MFVPVLFAAPNGDVPLAIGGALLGRSRAKGSVDWPLAFAGKPEEAVADSRRCLQQGVRVPAAVDLLSYGDRGSPRPRAQDPFDCSRSARFTRSTAGGITSPIPAHARSVTARS